MGEIGAGQTARHKSSNPMRVIYFSKDYTTHDWRYLDKLAQTSHQVWYLRLEKGLVELERRPIPQGIRLIAWAGGQGPAQGLVNQLRLFPGLCQVLRRIKPDLIHAGPIQSCGFLSALTGFRPVLLMSWGSDILINAERNPLWRWVTRFTLRHAGIIVGDCRAVREKVHQLVDYPDDRIVSYPWGIDLETFKPGPSRLALRQQLGWQDKRVIIFTRSWEPLYGIDVLLEAFAKTVRQLSDARLLLIGYGSLASNVHRFIEENGLSQFVHLSGQVPHEQVVDYFNMADVYVSSTYSDGTSISLLEAMACALPVVVSDIPGNREWITPGINGWLAKPADASSLSSALLQALGNAASWAQMGEANLAIARERADWNKNFRVLLNTYEQLATARQHG